jgi:hypothetical protein
MQLPRVRLTVGWILVAVAVIGMDLGLLRGACQADEREPCTSRLSLHGLDLRPAARPAARRRGWRGVGDQQVRFGLAVRDGLPALWRAREPRRLSRIRCGYESITRRSIRLNSGRLRTRPNIMLLASQFARWVPVLE